MTPKLKNLTLIRKSERPSRKELVRYKIMRKNIISHVKHKYISIFYI